MRNISNMDKILSKNEVDKLKKAYNNYNISEDCFIFDVKSIMENERVSKEKAISNILRLINN